jgi:hypothetical protein
LPVSIKLNFDRETTMRRSIFLYFIAIVGFGSMAAGCAAPPVANTNTNMNMSANTNSAPVNANTNSAPESLAAISAREPDKYRATLTFSAETGSGEKTIGIPTLSVAVARRGDDRRVAFKLPDGSDLIYLDSDSHHYVLLPTRKQYAELTQEAVGFQIQRLMTPGQLVRYLEKLKGVERVGEEPLNGRTAIKYSYSSTVNTQSQAGEVKNQAYVYVDKETGLPLRSELTAEASGNVKGMKSAKIVAEMHDISTDVDASAFTVPANLSKIPPEQVRAQIDAVTSTAAAVIKTLLANMNATPSITPPPTSAASPAASATP